MVTVPVVVAVVQSLRNASHINSSSGSSSSIISTSSSCSSSISNDLKLWLSW